MSKASAPGGLQGRVTTRSWICKTAGDQPHEHAVLLTCKSAVEPQPSASPATRRQAPTRSTEDAERLLLARIASGDAAAFDALYRLYHPRLVRFLGRMLHRTNCVDEVVNDTLLVVWQRGGSFGERSKLSTWIFGIAYRKALKALRRWDGEVLQPESDADIAASLESGPSPEEAVARRDVRRALHTALQELSREQRAVIELCYFQDLNVAEIAHVLGCPAGTVKTRMFYARQRLQPLLKAWSARAEGAMAES